MTDMYQFDRIVSAEPLFEDAVKIVRNVGRASTSDLQRALRIPYGRAVHLLDLMEAAQIIAPANGHCGPRSLVETEVTREQGDLFS